MKICCTGPHGHVGKALVRRGVIPLNCDVTKIDEVRREVKKVSPDIIINTASKTSVDWCDESQENYLDALRVNKASLFVLDKEYPHIPIVSLSTDHVFPGKRFIDVGLGWRWHDVGPYKEDDWAFPVNGYGLTKLASELVAEMSNNVKIVRTSNLFYRDDPRVVWYLDDAYKKDKVKVPTFQKRSFMHVEHFVSALLEYVENYDKMPDMLHISGIETVSWFVFLKAFCDAIDFPFKSKFVRKWFDEKGFVERPKSGGLDTSLSAKLGITQYSYLDGMELL